jgi:hypothetical protein
MAMIGDIPETWASRSVVVLMQKKREDETRERLTSSFHEELHQLRDKVTHWAAEHSKSLGTSDPTIPKGIANRTADNLRPLFAIADQIGGPWPDRARNSARAILSRTDVGHSHGERLLHAIAETWPEGADRAASEGLCKALADSEYGPVSQPDLARRLRPFGIRPKQLWFGEKSKGLKGYMLSDFDDAFGRYRISIGAKGSKEPKDGL